MSKEEMETFNLKLPPAMREQLHQLAIRNERTLAAEMRVALRAHLEKEGATEPAAV